MRLCAPAQRLQISATTITTLPTCVVPIFFVVTSRHNWPSVWFLRASTVLPEFPVHFASHEGLISVSRHSARGGTNNFWWAKVLALHFWYPESPCCAPPVQMGPLVFASPIMGPISLDHVKFVYPSVSGAMQAIRGDGRPAYFSKHSYHRAG